jgi:sugar (pentulose or hexulose) kinase
VLVAGRLSRSDLLCKLLAAALQTPVTRVDEEEITSRGVLALLGGLTVSVNGEAFPPDDAWAEALNARYRTWRELIG